MKKIPFSMHEIIGAFVVALLFIVSAYLSGMYSDEINELIGSHTVWGIFL